MQVDLDKLIIFLADNPNMGLKISGHTDSQGDVNRNLRLSQARADAIKSYILSKGKFKPERIEAIGFGNTKPIVSQEQSEEDRKLNRRVEFEIVKLQ